MKNWVVAVLLGLGASSLGAMGQIDVSGVPLGIGQVEGRAAIQKVNSQYTVSELKTREGKPAGWKAVIANPRRPQGGYGENDHFLILTDDVSSTAWFVGRFQSFLKADRLGYDTLVKALKDKYGPPTSAEGTDRLRWEFDRAGILYHGRQPGGPCPPTQDANPIQGIYMPVPDTFSSRCGMRIEVQMVRDFEGLVKGFTLGISDDKVKFDEADAKATRDAGEKQRERDAARFGNKPKL